MDKELEQLHELKARFAYMFNGPNLGLDIYRGWLSDFINACKQIDAILGNDKISFHFSQIKEKYGWSRYYFDTDRADLMRASFRDDSGRITEQILGLKDEHVIEKQIAAILSEAEQKSMTKCIVCGDAAEIKNHGSWLVCACEKHSPEDSGDQIKKAALK